MDINTPLPLSGALRLSGHDRHDFDLQHELGPRQLNDLHKRARRRRDPMAEIREMQENFYRAFYNAGETTRLRLNTLEDAVFGIRDRLATFEKRLFELEKKVNFPNAS